jgi:sigma-B regulation protein RsbU (phosphoserine phosphatase)
MDVATGSVHASIFSKSSEGSRGGDIYYFSVCGTGNLTRIALADVQGHGEEVSQVSKWLYELVRDSMDSLDATQVLSTLNQRALDHGFEAMSTVAVLSYYVGDNHLYVSYAGHPPALLRRKAGDVWAPMKLDEGAGLSNLPLGMFPDVIYDQKILPLEIGDRFVVYSDGLTEYPDATGQPLGSNWLMRCLLDGHSHSLDGMKRSVLAALAQQNALGMNHDDITLMIAEIAEPLPAMVDSKFS